MTVLVEEIVDGSSEGDLVAEDSASPAASLDALLEQLAIPPEYARYHTIEDLAETYMTWAHANAALLRTDMLAGASLAFRQRWPCGR